MGEPSVKQIVERCQQGDRKAFGQLYTLTKCLPSLCE